MKKIPGIISLLLLTMATSSYAADTQSGSVSFLDAVRVGSNNLPAGKYSVRWQAGANDVQVTISGNGHQVSVPATISPSTVRDQVLTHRDGTAQVVEGFTVKDTNFTLKTP